jgi:peroxiredoxin family protein
MSTQPQTLHDLSDLDTWLDQRLDEKLREREEAKTPSLSIISTKGTLDQAYPPFILASTAAALGWDVNVFFTFYGLSLLKKDLDLKISPLGNPAMPLKLPVGPDWLKTKNLPIPNLVKANIPGFEDAATALMKETVKRKGVASIEELRELCVEADVNLIGCQMTADLFGWDKSEFHPAVQDWAGAATYLPLAQKSDVSLFI